MTITIGAWIIPLVISLILFVIMIRPNPNGGGFMDMTPIVRLLWMIPILGVWLVYFIIVACLK